MKYKLLRFTLLLLLLAMGGVTSVWADELANPYVHVFSTTAKTFEADGAQTLSGVEWTLAVNWTDEKNTDYNKDGNQGMKIGSNSKTPESMTLTSTDGDIPGTITSVKVSASARSQALPHLTVTVGETVFKCDNKEYAEVGSGSSTEYTFTGEGSGSIEIKYEHTGSKKGAFYVAKIEVEYSSAGDDRVSTTLTITPDQITGTIDDEIDLPAVTVMAGETEVSDPTIEWTSDNEDIVIIEESKLKLLDAGKATITATYPGDTDYKSSKNTLTVIVGNAIEDGVFDFTGYQNYGSGIIPGSKDVPLTNANDSKTFTAGNITFTITALKKNQKFAWYPGDDKDKDENGYKRNCLRIYDNTTQVLSAPEGYAITQVTINGYDMIDKGGIEGQTFDSNEYTWTGKQQTVNITRSSTFRIYTIDVAYEEENRPTTTLTINNPKAGGLVGNTMPLPTVTVTAEDGTVVENPEILWSSSKTDCADIDGNEITMVDKKAGETTITAKFIGNSDYQPSSASYSLKVEEAPEASGEYSSLESLPEPTAEGTIVKLNVENMLVKFVSGSYTYIGEESDGMLLSGSDLGLTAGDMITGTIYGTLKLNNNRPQINTKAAYINVTVTSSGNTFRPMTITPENLDKYVNQYIRIENAQYTPSNEARGMEKALSKTLYFTVGDEVFIVYNQFELDLSALEEEGATEKRYSLTGFGTVYKEDYELYLTEPLVTDSVISWDFQNKLPESIVNTHIEGAGATGTVESTKNGVVMQVLGETAETNIKLAYNEQGYAQFNQGTVLRVPVEKAGDVVTVTSYPGQYKYNVGGTAATADVTEHIATAGEGAKGYVEVIATSTAYLYCITSTVKAPAGLVTANDKEVTATFKFDQGTDGQKADFGADANMFVNSKVTYGSNLSIKGKDSKGWSETVFGTAAKETTAGESNAIRFLIQPKNGLTFQPTKVSFRSTRFGTDGGLLNISWLNSDGTTAILDSDKKPNRDNETPHESEFSYDISHVYASTGACGLVVNLFSLDPGKTVGLADIVIEGTMNGTEVEIPVLASFKANGKVYEADGLFEADGEQYTATVMLSKKEKMISTANPVTDIVASTGTVNTDDIRYEVELTKCLVTIPVSLSGKTTNYVINFVHKPDFTLSYISPEDGQTVLTTQQVEMDAPIGEFAGDAMSNYAIPKGYKMRGWFAKPVGSVSNRKFTVEDIVTSDLKLYGIATEIEGPSTTKKYTFDLTDQYFYAEDHEAFNPTGTGKFHDNKHGWSFANGDLIDLLVGEKANISVGVCQYSAAGSKLVVKDAEGQTIGSMDAQADADGTTMTYTYQGKAGKVTLAVEASGAIYLHNVKIANTADINYDKQGDWYFVKAGNAASLLDVLEVVNGTNAAKDAPRAFIFLPDGTYDLGATVKTAISGHNISIIGQSADGTIITTKPDKSIEGLGSADMLQASSTNLYLQDLTLKNALDYYNAGSAGRAAVLQDAGTRTVGKNVRMLSFQDTYYSSNNSQQAYWETCDIHGTVDFICGGGDIRFQNTTISLEPRALDGKGSRTITAPTTKTEFGYVFDGCKVVDLAEGKGNWNFGRTWLNTPVCVYLNTTLDDNAKSTLISTRWIEKGMNNKDPKLFGEYGTKDENGTDITPKSNIIKSHGGEFETILSAEQAAGFAYNKMFTDWDPASLTKQAAAPAGAKYDNGTVSWTGSSDAIAYAVFKNGKFVGLTEANSFNITIDGSVDGLTVRAANKMGGLGEAAPVAGTTGIEATQVADGQDVIYNLQGIRLNKAGKGLYIINGRKVVK